MSCDNQDFNNSWMGFDGGVQDGGLNNQALGAGDFTCGGQAGGARRSRRGTRARRSRRGTRSRRSRRGTRVRRSRRGTRRGTRARRSRRGMKSKKRDCDCPKKCKQCLDHKCKDCKNSNNCLCKKKSKRRSSRRKAKRKGKSGSKERLQKFTITNKGLQSIESKIGLGYASPPAKGEWQCPKCSLNQHKKATKCEVCETPKGGV